MIALVVFLMCLILTVACGCVAAYSDVRSLLISNRYSIAVAGLYSLCFVVLYAFGKADVLPSLVSSLVAAAVFFGVSFVMFSVGILGAADSKLGTVFALWVGVPGLAGFLFYMTLVGGVLALVSLGLKRWKPLSAPFAGGWVDRAQRGESKIPYGVAILTGALASFYFLGYFKYETFTSFM